MYTKEEVQKLRSDRDYLRDQYAQAYDRMEVFIASKNRRQKDRLQALYMEMKRSEPRTFPGPARTPDEKAEYYQSWIEFYKYWTNFWRDVVEGVIKL
jgi:hypothetical protein